MVHVHELYVVCIMQWYCNCEPLYLVMVYCIHVVAQGKMDFDRVRLMLMQRSWSRMRATMPL
jgi:hypothetical protein